MKASAIPTKFAIPFANSAGGGYVRSIPQASQIGITSGAASLTDGFPPLTFLPVGSGGTPPWGQDFNGLLNQITQWSQWQGAGGLAKYDAGFAASIGGYPQGAILAGASAGLVWLNLADDNTSNPDASGANWSAFVSAATLQNGTGVSYDDTGTTNVLAITPVPALSAYAKYQRFYVKVANTITGSATLNVSGLGAQTITRADGAPTQAGDLQAGEVVCLIYDGTNFQIAQLLTSMLPTGDGQNFTTSTTFTVPAHISLIKSVQVWGAGGGGGGCSGSNDYNGGAGGGGGGYARKFNIPVAPGQSITVTVGAGGTAGTTGGTAAGTGGSSSFGSFCSATGGAGGGFGSNAPSSSPGAGGSGSGGNINLSGGTGIASTGKLSVAVTNILGGMGGPSPFGGSVSGSSLNSPGVAGYFPGGGASGGAAINNGAAGAGGLIIIQY